MDKMMLLLIEVSVCVLNLILLSTSLYCLCRRTSKDLQDQMDDIGRTHSKFIFGRESSLQNANANLNFNKTLQWNYIYYIVLLFAAVHAVETQFGTSAAIQIILTISTNAVFHVGLYLTIDIQFQIRRERLSLINIQMRTTKERRTLSDLQSRKAASLCFLYSPYITITLLSTVGVGYAANLAFIISRTIN